MIHKKENHGKSLDTFIAASAIYQTLFNKKTIGAFDDNSTFILADNFVNDKFFEDQVIDDASRMQNIMASFDIIFLIGWKEHEG